MISAVVHTYNEEKNIDRCLSSLSFVDEIVLIDMGSNDKTVEIALDHGARTFPHEYTGFVEPARNFGIAKTKGEWVLIVDADEEIAKELAHYLKAETQNLRGDFYRLARKNIIFGKWVRHAGWWPDYQVRFFKKGAVLWTEKIHGVPMTKGTGVDIEPTEDLAIVHHHYQNLDQYIERLNRYTSVNAKELYISGTKFALSDCIKRPSREFISRFFVRHGIKDGMFGLALCTLQSFSELILYLKLWELEGYTREHISLPELVAEVRKERKHAAYWYFNELLKQPHTIMDDILLRIKRKLASNG